MFKKLVTFVLEHQARRLIKKFKPKLVAVVGSVGKTSTKIAIATVLAEKYKVQAHYGSYNVPVSVPLSMFNLRMPSNIKNPFAWFGIMWQAHLKLAKPTFEFDAIVIELGADHVGDIKYFKRYLKPDISVVTAVSAEHMEYFGTIENVAKEELSVAEYSGLTIVNRDDIDSKFAKYANTKNISTYGVSGIAEYRFMVEDFDPNSGFKGKFISPEAGEQSLALHVVGEHNTKPVVAAGAVGYKLGLTPAQVASGMQKVVPVEGRMRLLKGLRDSTIIDDTYNASPIAVIAALKTLYTFKTPQRIAILGSMNELGNYSKQAHEEVANACDSSLLDWVVTIGNDAKNYLAPVAIKRNCQVKSFDSPYDAGAFVHSILQPGAVVLAKGSQNGVFAEEALKLILHDATEQEMLVRQTNDWLKVKEQQFGKFNGKK